MPPSDPARHYVTPRRRAIGDPNGEAPSVVWDILAPALAKVDVQLKRRERLKAAVHDRDVMAALVAKIEARRAEKRKRMRRKQTLAGMLERGELSEACHVAATEITVVVETEEDGQLAAAILAERVDSSFKDGAGLQWCDAVANVAKWRALLRAGAYGFGDRGPRTYLAVMLALDDHSMREIENALGMRNGSCSEYVRHGLEFYADIRAGRVTQRRHGEGRRKSA